jgi:hypothetical protein
VVETASLLQATIIFTEESIRVVMYLMAWSNFFLNILFMLIIIEISQMITVSYWRYRKDNL